MRKFLTVLVVLLVLSVAGFIAYRSGVHPSVVAWMVTQTWERTRDLDAGVMGDLEILGIPMQVDGTIRYKAPDLADLDVRTLRLICAPDDLWVVVPAIRTAFRVHSDRLTPMQMLANMLGSDEPGHHVAESIAKPDRMTLRAPVHYEDEACWRLEWPGRTGESRGGRLTVSQKTRLPVLFEQLDTVGAVLRTYKVTDLHRNSGLTREDFIYKADPRFAVVSYDYDPADPEALRDMLQGGAKELGELGRKVKEYLPPEANDWLRRHGIQ